MQTVGVIRHLARYPVKSMRGESLPSATLTLQGFADDRCYAFVQAASRSSFPWLTGRELPEMLRYQPAVAGSGGPDPAVTVTLPDGQNWPVQSEELRRVLETRSGRQVFLLRDYRGCYDAAPVSVISRQTIARIANESGTEENLWRFRPNLVIELDGGAAFDELRWVGRILRLGSQARIAITEPDRRCMMITLDPETVSPSPSVLRYVAQQFQQQAGVYATVLTPGEVRLGDSVIVET